VKAARQESGKDQHSAQGNSKEVREKGLDVWAERLVSLAYVMSLAVDVYLVGMPQAKRNNSDGPE